MLINLTQFLLIKLLILISTLLGNNLVTESNGFLQKNDLVVESNGFLPPNDFVTESNGFLPKNDLVLGLN